MMHLWNRPFLGSYIEEDLATLGILQLNGHRMAFNIQGPPCRQRDCLRNCKAQPHSTTDMYTALTFY